MSGIEWALAILFMVAASCAEYFRQEAITQKEWVEEIKEELESRKNESEA